MFAGKFRQWQSSLYIPKPVERVLASIGGVILIGGHLLDFVNWIAFLGWDPKAWQLMGMILLVVSLLAIVWDYPRVQNNTKSPIKELPNALRDAAARNRELLYKQPVGTSLSPQSNLAIPPLPSPLLFDVQITPRLLSSGRVLVVDIKNGKDKPLRCKVWVDNTQL